jgi:hypothetical protein
MTVGLILLALISSANADPLHPVDPACAAAGRSDSFGLGMKDQVLGTGSALDFELADAACYGLGKQYAAENATGAACEGDFARGRAHAIAGDGSYARTACESLGSMAGMAEIRVAARQGDASVAGEECCELYCRGLTNARSGGVSEIDPGLGPKEQGCFHQGYFEASIASGAHCYR